MGLEKAAGTRPASVSRKYLAEQPFARETLAK
jgi:hypothetical protein